MKETNTPLQRPYAFDQLARNIMQPAVAIRWRPSLTDEQKREITHEGLGSQRGSAAFAKLVADLSKPKPKHMLPSLRQFKFTVESM
ncbi:hypothetical protein N7495_000201 [Penicillium taxi]|uniref:uncharacterized protein n=1 Tax=Penicillium taxi TaxID=168475 RepID=UPI002545AA96|nr:uncharacterized protein N7495_000201 [Penicillium taxi]KAJ5907519.1 hypothetical protein N7495_000201 [Penicillium taxi]